MQRNKQYHIYRKTPIDNTHLNDHVWIQQSLAERNAEKNPLISGFCLQIETFWPNENAKTEPQ